MILSRLKNDDKRLLRFVAILQKLKKIHIPGEFFLKCVLRFGQDEDVVTTTITIIET